MKNVKNTYVIKVKGESLSDWRGAVPADIDPLVKKPSKDVASLIYQIAKTEVELLLQKGDVQKAVESVKKYQEQGHEYAAPLNCFKRDNQNGGAPFMGAHSFIGAFRDSAIFLHPEAFFQKKGDGKPARKHLRKFLTVRPFHVFLYRDGEKIFNTDEIEGQQPVGDAVKGFARYEVIHFPFLFDFNLTIIPKGPFAKFLGSVDEVISTLHHSTYMGIGSCRGANYGAWEIKEYEVDLLEA